MNCLHGFGSDEYADCDHGFGGRCNSQCVKDQVEFIVDMWDRLTGALPMDLAYYKAMKEEVEQMRKDLREEL